MVLYAFGTYCHSVSDLDVLMVYEKLLLMREETIIRLYN